VEAAKSRFDLSSRLRWDFVNIWDIIAHMPSVFNRFLTVKSIFDIAEQPGLNMVGVMSPLHWAVVEKSQALMSDQFFVEVRFKISHAPSELHHC
jgi:hypothetical protein